MVNHDRKVLTGDDERSAKRPVNEPVFKNLAILEENGGE
jgi:hypothetical protein